MPKSNISRPRALDDYQTKVVAHELIACGLPITLCPPDSKKPLGDGWNAEHSGRGWQRKEWSRREVDRAFFIRGALNVGLRFGPESGLIDIEADSPEALRDYANLFDDDLPVTPTFQSSRGPHRLFRWDDRFAGLAKATVHFRDLEIRLGAGGRGAHSLIPPSSAGGLERRWLVSLDECNPVPLPDSVVQRILELATTPSSSSRLFTQNIACVSVSLCKSDRARLDAAVRETRPSGYGHRYRQLFVLARRLKAIPTIAAADRTALRSIVQRWHSAALPYISTKPFDETWADFSIAWANIKYGAGEGPLHDTFQRALAAPISPTAMNYDLSEIRSLVALCQQLQITAGDGSFYLACRAAADLLGISHVTANKWLRLLEQDGVITCTRTGTRSKASEFRYLAT